MWCDSFIHEHQRGANPFTKSIYILIKILIKSSKSSIVWRRLSMIKKLMVYNYLSLTLSKASSNPSKALRFLSFHTTQKIARGWDSMFLYSTNTLPSPNLFPHRTSQLIPVTYKSMSIIYTQRGTKREYDYRTPPPSHIRNVIHQHFFSSH